MEMVWVFYLPLANIRTLKVELSQTVEALGKQHML